MKTIRKEDIVINSSKYTSNSYLLDSIKFSVKYATKTSRDYNDKWKCHASKYSCKLTRNNKTISLQFFTGNGAIPKVKEVLYCLLQDSKFANLTFREFCVEMSCEETCHNNSIFKSCKRAYNQLHKLFSNSELEELEEILEQF